MLIFDMDGTLIDSNGIWRQVDEAFLAKRGYPYTREYYEGVAHTIFPMAAKFTKAYCHLEESEEEIMAEWMQMAGDAYAVRVPIKPGVREYLDRCRAAGERMIVLTSSVPEHCRAALGRLGLTEYFERILFAHDLGMDKKDPETFRHAAALMGVTPEDCREVFICAAAWSAAAGYFTQQSAASWNIESFTVGDVSVKTTGLENTSQMSAPQKLEWQARMLMRPFCRPEGFAFVGVRG